MSDERFFEKVRSTMSNYAPEVPQAAYGKMRRALWWSNFTKLSAGRFNMWYLLLLLGIGGGAMAWYGNTNDGGQGITHSTVPVENTIQTGFTSAPAVTGNSDTSLPAAASTHDQHASSSFSSYKKPCLPGCSAGSAPETSTSADINPHGEPTVGGLSVASTNGGSLEGATPGEENPTMEPPTTTSAPAETTNIAEQGKDGRVPYKVKTIITEEEARKKREAKKKEDLKKK